ncbi:acyltransferase [Thermoleophilia bacterium SCSIO 60948]|nr:acyltransferase [Thermoleophilia bacterium SCSIO 60948]
MNGRFRADIEGLRAVTLGAVLLAHAGVPFARGGFAGVDVFFVISGFLITGLLIRELESTGTISLARFWSARVRRLLPLAAIVLVFVVAGTRLFLSPVDEDLVSSQVIASALYFVNWVFMAQSVDYFGTDVDASPVQHFWTLSVEEQFYVFWPVLLIAASLWWRRSGRAVRPRALVLASAIGIASFAYGLAFTAGDPEQAYFSTFARAWELALGAVIALAPVPRLGERAARALGWAGMASIAATVLFLDGADPFPGVAALLPTLGAAALIVAGRTQAGRWSASRILTAPAARHVGRLSYSWYLWHWPLLIFAAAILGGPLSALEGLAVVALAYFPAALSHALVERPLHHAAIFVRRRTAAVALWGTATASVLGATIVLAAPAMTQAPRDDVTGARALGSGSQLQLVADSVRPAPDRALRDRGRLIRDGCFLNRGETEQPECVYGDRDAKRTVVLLGDSHAMQFFPALEPIAKRAGWRLVVMTKGGCPPIDGVWSPTVSDGEDCLQWRDAMLERIASERPDFVITGTDTDYPVDPSELERGYADVIERVGDARAEVIAFKNPPSPPTDIPRCVARSLDSLDDCAFALPDDLAGNFEDRAIAVSPDTDVIDVIPDICGVDGRCAAVIGNALVYRNTNHLTATFVRSLVPAVRRQLPRELR